MKLRLASLLIAVVLCASCNGEKFAEGRQLFRDLLSLRDQISKEFQEKVVDVNLANGDRMTIKFIDSPFSTRSYDEKQQRADAVATFVAEHYKHPLSSVAVQFVSKTGAVGATETFVGRATNPRAPSSGSPNS